MSSFSPDFSSFKGARVVIFIPTFNCESTIISVINRIPKVADAAILVVDNCSTDNTVAVVGNLISSGNAPYPLVVLSNPRNLGYSGSQKAAYELVREMPSVEWMIMLHGDGQYDPQLISRLVPEMKTDADVVYGYRSKREPTEETPLLSFAIIKILSVIESAITGYLRKEWHSGFVMYRTRFLRRVELQALTTTPHIDGHLLFVAGLLQAKTKPVRIYKRYKELTVFEGAARRKYVLDVLLLMFQFRRTRIEAIERTKAPDQAFEPLV